MKTEKIASLIMTAFLFTGLAAADTPDIPEPGLTPDSPLYGFEKISERLELAVATAPVIGSEELEAKVRANHAAETLAEARAMAEKNRTEQVEKLMNRYSENMNKSIASASAANETELKQRLKNVTDNQNQALAELENKVPEQARVGIKKAMENNRKNQEKLGNRPAGTPGAKDPGQQISPGENQERPSKEDQGGSPITGRSTNPGTPEDRERSPEKTGENDTAKTPETQKENGQESSAVSEPSQESDGGENGAMGGPDRENRP